MRPCDAPAFHSFLTAAIVVGNSISPAGQKGNSCLGHSIESDSSAFSGVPLGKPDYEGRLRTRSARAASPLSGALLPKSGPSSIHPQRTKKGDYVVYKSANSRREGSQGGLPTSHPVILVGGQVFLAAENICPSVAERPVERVHIPFPNDSAPKLPALPHWSNPACTASPPKLMPPRSLRLLHRLMLHQLPDALAEALRIVVAL